MAQNTRELRRRIKSTKSIRQITKAMEMIAASKMRKAQLAALASRPYANLAWEMLSSLWGKYEHLELEESSALAKFFNPAMSGEKTLVVLVTTNRGLCGSLNPQLVNEAVKLAKNNKEDFGFVVVGRKGLRSLSRLGFHVIASFDGFENQPAIAEILPIAQVAQETFMQIGYSKVLVVYADFISTLQYKVRTKQLLPVAPHMTFLSEGIKLEVNLQEKIEDYPQRKTKFLFEPSPEVVLSSLLPRLVELQLYQAIVENLASEHSARMVNMKNASDSARDIINDLTLTYNSVRQASITADLADIIGGRMAVK